METLHYLKEALTRNWSLKLLALALAIVIYHSMKPAGNGSRSTLHNDRIPFQEKH